MVIGNNKSKKKKTISSTSCFGQYLISATESKLKQIGIVNMGYCCNRLDRIVGRKVDGIFCGSLEDNAERNSDDEDLAC